MGSSRLCYPGTSWEPIAASESTGWDLNKLQRAKTYAEQLGSAAVVVVIGGTLVIDWGQIARPLNCHSIRKSLLSGLFGMHIHAGHINLTATLAALGIDDAPPLSAQEKQATIADLLKSRSGVYHWANYQPDLDRSFLPPRDTYAPGQFFIYNNWDFNALGTIFEQCTQTSIFDDFAQRIAHPLHMEDFRLQDTEYVGGPDSIHPAYVFRLSARDLARYGLLYLRGGRWYDQQIIPESWVRQSTTAYSRSPDGRGYGYMWWVAANGMLLPQVSVQDGAYAAFAVGAHFMVILPYLDMIVVHRYDTDQEDFDATAPSPFEQGQLLHFLLDAYRPAMRVYQLD
jgi:CubicO group peptidase (beta-lactamase class C family)